MHFCIKLPCIITDLQWFAGRRGDFLVGGKFPKNNCSKSFLTNMNFHKVKVISCIFWHCWTRRDITDRMNKRKGLPVQR